MTSEYLFTIAAVIAVISILFVFKLNLDKLKQKPEKLADIQTKFFIGVAIAEVIPIIFVVLGFAASEPVTMINQLIIPGIIILISLMLAPFFIFLQTKVDVTENIKGIVSTFSLIGIALSLSIPIISLIGLIMLMPN